MGSRKCPSRKNYKLNERFFWVCVFQLCNSVYLNKLPSLIMPFLKMDILPTSKELFCLPMQRQNLTTGRRAVRTGHLLRRNRVFSFGRNNLATFLPDLRLLKSTTFAKFLSWFRAAVSA